MGTSQVCIKILSIPAGGYEELNLTCSLFRCYNEYPSIGSGEWGPSAPYEWQTHREIEGDEPFISHCSFSIIHYADPEEPLRRSEVLPIVAYMKWRMRQVIYLEHYTFPVSRPLP